MQILNYIQYSIKIKILLQNSHYKKLHYKNEIFRKKIKFFFTYSLIIIISYGYQYIMLNCKAEDLFKGIKIYFENETLDEILFNNKSISRFGDGEFYLIYGGGNYFQKYDKNLIKKLKIILKSNEDGLLIGINIPYKKYQFDRYIDNVKKYYIKYINNYKFKIYRLLNKKKKYYSSIIGRFYIDFKDKSGIPKYIKKLKRIWDKRDIFIIEGEKSRLGVGNDLFKNANSIKRILCPVQNAFKVYKKIIKKVQACVDKHNLILLALGPTATVLAFDLYRLGYQVIDIGHLDIEYEWFLKNTTVKIQIENKYVAEVNGAKYNFTKVKDKNYYKQIIAQILN